MDAEVRKYTELFLKNDWQISVIAWVDILVVV